MTLKNVKVLYDRRKTSEHRGTGTVEFLVYLSRLQRKYINYGECTPIEWLKLRKSKTIEETAKQYQSVVYLMQMNGLPMTIEKFNELAGLSKPIIEQADEEKKNEPLLESFLDFMEDGIINDNIAPYTKQQRLVALRSLKEFGRIVTWRGSSSNSVPWVRSGCL